LQSDATSPPKRRQITIGPRTFDTKADAERAVRAILIRHEPMQEVRGDDLAFILAILDIHPNREVIVDCGVQRIVVQYLSDKYDSRRFLAIRTDASIRDFTWRHALYPKTAKDSVMRACRWAIRDEIREFRDKAFAQYPTLICTVSGRQISPIECDVDHIHPRTFERLVAAWLRANHIEMEDVALIPVAGYQQPDRWEDKFLLENWREYHRTHAHLRVVHPFANRSILRKVEEGERV